MFSEGKWIPKTNTEYWIEKFERNIKRDNEVNARLETNGWVVLRFFESEISKNIYNCVAKIQKALNI
jgi:DNA mismatch endonuclease (patch repair protein)